MRLLLLLLFYIKPNQPGIKASTVSPKSRQGLYRVESVFLFLLKTESARYLRVESVVVVVFFLFHVKPNQPGIKASTVSPQNHGSFKTSSENNYGHGQKPIPFASSPKSPSLSSLPQYVRFSTS